MTTINTELPDSTPAIPPNADEATLRKLHKQVLDAIKQKREPAALIPAPERRILVSLAKRMDVPFIDLVKHVEALRTNPITRALRIRKNPGAEQDADPIQLFRIERVTKNQEIAILSNGAIATHTNTRWQWAPAPGEWVQLSGSGGMVKAIGVPFMDAWDALQVPPDLTTAQVMLGKAGVKDIPQETLVTWLIETATLHMTRLITDLMEHKRVTIRDLIIARLDKTPEEDTYYNRSTFPAFSQAFEAWCVTRNLIAEDLRTSLMFDIPVEDIWAGYASVQRLANTRAAALRDAVAKALGFKRNDREHGGWTKWTKSREGRDDRIDVYDTGKIEINGNFRCVIEAVSVALPEADQVVRRMLTLATPHRNQIFTLAKDLPLLERAWPHIPSIWRLVEDAEQQIDRGEVTKQDDDE